MDRHQPRTGPVAQPRTAARNPPARNILSTGIAIKKIGGAAFKVGKYVGALDYSRSNTETVWVRQGVRQDFQRSASVGIA